MTGGGNIGGTISSSVTNVYRANLDSKIGHSLVHEGISHPSMEILLPTEGK